MSMGSGSGAALPGGAPDGRPSSSSSRSRHRSRAPPSAYRISSSTDRPGGPCRFRTTVTALRCPTTSRPSRIQPVRTRSRRSPLASPSAAASPVLVVLGSTITSSDPARRASAASRPSRSPTRTLAAAGSWPSGRSTTNRSTVRAESSAAVSLSASSRSTGVSTTSHSGHTPRATASTGSKARARSSQATIAPAACASAATRNASVVLPDETSPRSVTVVERGRPPVPSMASSLANPVETMRPSGSSIRCPGLGAMTGANGAGPGTGTEGSGSAGIGIRARAPSTASAISPPRRGAAAPQRARRIESASETSDERAIIGRPIIEHPFYSSSDDAACGPGAAGDSDGLGARSGSAV